MFRWFARIATAMLLLHTFTAQAAPAFDEGKAYTRLAVPQAVSPSDKVVVTEFFWYNCPHCSELEPQLESWARQLPSYVVLERVPVAFTPRFVPQQKLYYTLLALGKVGSLQAAVFRAIHEQHIPLNTPDQMADWLAARGIPKATFLATYDSFGVAMQARRATQMMKDYGIDGVPTLAVQGRYEVSADLPQTPTHTLVLQAASELIGKAHADMAAGR